MDSTGCPNRAELSEFAIGILSEPVFARIAGHVEHCPACESALQKLEALADPLLIELRKQGSPGKGTVDQVPPELITAARSAGDRGQPGPGSAAGCPRRLGKFELLEELGTGSFATVYRARDTELDRLVAIKIPRAGWLGGRQHVDRFLREARSAAQLKHAGIVALYETGQSEEGTCYLVEEFVQGVTLAERLKAGPLSFRQAAELVALVADALHYAHDQGVIHRDIKPSNIMLDPEGRPHLMDFGLAKREAGEITMTQEGQVLGTPAYMSPEQARGESHHVDARSDIYSLGVVFYELLTGELPFQGNRRMLILQVLEDEPRPPRRWNDKLPRDLETICLKAMGKTPARRYASTRELADDLRRYLREEPILARPIGSAERLWRWCRRNPLAASLLVGVSLGSALAVGYLYLFAERLAKSAALESAAQMSEMLEDVNDLYSSQVVDRLPPGIKVTHDYPSQKGAIPLPATFTIDLGKYLGAKGETGVQIRLYSDYPFPWRKNDGGPRDPFEQTALARLRQSSREPVYEFTVFEGRPALRYATARLMKASCVHCHNNHPDTPKRDWQEGDVRGVVEIIRPLDRDYAQARQGLQGTFVPMVAIFVVLMGLTAVVLLGGNRRRKI